MVSYVCCSAAVIGQGASDNKLSTRYTTVAKHANINTSNVVDLTVFILWISF